MTAAEQPAGIGPFLVLRKLGEGGMGVVYAGYDPTLDRKVALKLIRRSLLGSEEIRARMIREAQAMARLSHTNVAQVYQVGEHGDQIFMAMEFVEGHTLSAWLKEARRPWPLALRTVIAAGRGLAAAHAAGLVHRDFKPDNVLVGTDGGARVVDFGLVNAEGAALPHDASEVRASTSGVSVASVSRISTQSGSTSRSGIHNTGSVRLTQVGKVLGTPAYMSPEQHFGEEVGPASDQFSFGITLYEALYGVRPFPGQTWGEIKQQVRRGEVPPPPRDVLVPRRVFRIIERSLMPNPEARWPTLARMLDELERDPRRRALRVAGVLAFAATAAAGSYAAAVIRHGEAQRCADTAQGLAGVWDAERAGAAERAFAATRAAFAGDTWLRVHARLDAYALAWTSGQRAACEEHANGLQSTALFDRRTRCLAQRRAHLAALVEVFVAADRSVLEHAVQATAALPSVESCGDVDAMLAAAAPPEDAETAAQVESWRERLARASALEATGQYARGLDLVKDVRVAADGLRYAPLTAEAALGEGTLWMATGRAEEAEASLTEALRIGLVHGLDAVAAEAAARRIFVLGELAARRAGAIEGAAVAESLAERAGDPRITALVHNNLGAVLERDDDPQRAREHYLTTLELLRGEASADPLIAVVHHNLGGLLRGQGRLEEGRDHYAQAARLFAELLGATHPLLAHPLGGMADIDAQAGRIDAAIEGYTRALALMETAYGADNVYLLHPLLGLGQVHARAGRQDVAVAALRRAIELGERSGTTHEMYAEALTELAGLVAPDEALALLGRAATVYEADGGPQSPGIAAVAVRAGALAAAAGDRAGARGWFERGLSAGTGRSGQAEARALAALGWMRLAGPGDEGRVCTLVLEVRGGFGIDDPRRAEADALAIGCAAGR